MVKPNEGLRPGDRVQVPWGLAELPGVVQEVYQTSTGLRAVVEVQVPGSQGDEMGTVTVPYHVEDLEEPGLWDVLAEVEELLPAMSDASSRIAGMLTDLGTNANRYTERIQALASRNAPASERLRLLDSYAEELERIAVPFDELSVSFGDLVDRLERDVRYLMRHTREEGEEAGAVEFLTALDQMSEGATVGIEGIERLVGSLNSIMNLSKSVRQKAKILRDAAIRTVAYMRRVVDLSSDARQRLAGDP